ncbi:AlpA family phage regulatory protein [Vibrio fluvialis]|nr:AlpA family phage regulatory protein [Vibrio fluvialis]RCW20503.1 AlpA family transcriptional regulator [Vibrio parahaemolyticus]
MQQYVRAKEIAKLLGVNQSTIWRWRKQNRFPAPTYAGPNTVLWSRSEIDEWIKSQHKSTY